MFVLALNFMDNQLAHITTCKGPSNEWKDLYNIHKTKYMSNIWFVRHKFFMCKMDEGDIFLDDVNKVKALVAHLVCLEDSMRTKLCHDYAIKFISDIRVFYHYLRDNAHE